MTVWRVVAVVVGLALIATATHALNSPRRRQQRVVLVAAVLAWAVGLSAVVVTLEAVLQ